MHLSSTEHRMPHSCGRTPPGAMKLDAEDDKLMLKEKYCQEVLEHEECDTDYESS